MSGNHIPFQKLSELYDDEINSREEKASLMGHIEDCKACALEYRRLGKTLNFCRQVAGCSFPLENMPPQTMRKIKSAKKKKLYLKSMPAMAASIMVIAGIGLFNAGIIGVHNSADIADNSSRRSYTDSEQVIDIIRKNNATIATVTDQYVEGTVAVSSFDDLKKRLGSRKVAYMLMEESGEDMGASWGNPIENVGLGDGQVIMDRAPAGKDAGAGKKYIRFRVFR